MASRNGPGSNYVPAQVAGTLGTLLVRSSLIAAAVAALTGCVEPFPGSNVQMLFSPGVQTAARGAQAPQQPAANTYYSLYAKKDRIVVDDAGDEVVQASLFEVQRFEIRTVIDTSSPCFIELEDAKYPGLHSTQFRNRLEEDLGFSDPRNAPAGTDPGLITDLLGAERRLELQPELQNQLKAVTSMSTLQYPGVAAACGNTDPELIPPPQCTDLESNAKRLELCKAAWASDPNFYEGSDKVFSLPNAGTFYGMVDGTNPINNGFVGGSGLFVDESLVDIDAYVVSWQYKDLDGDGAPDYPVGAVESPTGVTYMTGVPEARTRGVTNVRVTNPAVVGIFAEIAIFPNLAEDDVQF